MLLKKNSKWKGKSRRLTLLRKRGSLLHERQKKRQLGRKVRKIRRKCLLRKVWRTPQQLVPQQPPSRSALVSPLLLSHKRCPITITNESFGVSMLQTLLLFISRTISFKVSYSLCSLKQWSMVYFEFYLQTLSHISFCYIWFRF